LCLDEPSASFNQNESFVVHALGHKGRWFFSPLLESWLKLNLHRFDVVIVHGLWLYHGYATMKAFRRIKRKQLKDCNNIKVPKLYIMPHGMLDPYFQQNRSRRLKAIRNMLYWKLIEQEIIHEADGVLFTCEEEARLAREPFKPYNPKKELSIGYGISSPPKYSMELKVAFEDTCLQVAGKPYFLFLSRIHEKKGIELLIQAYLDLQARYDLPQLVIAGPGMETAYGQKISELVKARQKNKRAIYFTGMLSGNAKWGAIYGCTAFILPSHQENFGIAIVEALACAKPVLTTNKVNIWKEIKDSNSGIISDDTQEGISKMLETWVSLSPVIKEELGKNALQAYKDNFDIQKVALKFKTAIS
jgi:glycosyltransferase involved in cell wall biosynthesis